jgi:hypothetical protein
MVEMVRLAKELGVIGRDRVDETLDFRRIAGKKRPILAERIHSKRAQAAGDAAID